MKIKLVKLVNSINALGQLNNAHGLSGVCAYSIMKNVNKIEPELEMYNKTREKILVDRAKKDEDGKPIIIKETVEGKERERYDMTDENYNEANHELFTLLNSDIELDLTKISIEDLNNADLTPAQLSSIDYMIKE